MSSRIAENLRRLRERSELVRFSRVNDFTELVPENDWRRGLALIQEPRFWGIYAAYWAAIWVVFHSTTLHQFVFQDFPHLSAVGYLGRLIAVYLGVSAIVQIFWGAMAAAVIRDVGSIGALFEGLRRWPRLLWLGLVPLRVPALLLRIKNATEIREWAGAAARFLQCASIPPLATKPRLRDAVEEAAESMDRDFIYLFEALGAYTVLLYLELAAIVIAVVAKAQLDTPVGGTILCSLVFVAGMGRFFLVGYSALLYKERAQSGQRDTHVPPAALRSYNTTPFIGFVMALLLVSVLINTVPYQARDTIGRTLTASFAQAVRMNDMEALREVIADVPRDGYGNPVAAASEMRARFEGYTEPSVSIAPGLRNGDMLALSLSAFAPEGSNKGPLQRTYLVELVNDGLWNWRIYGIYGYTPPGHTHDEMETLPPRDVRDEVAWLKSTPTSYRGKL